MEMMIVLLIVAIIAAASAPMVSKKMMRDAEGGSPWMYAGLGGSITYNPDGNQNKTAMIGASTTPTGASKAKLYIETSSSEPQIAIGRSGDAKVVKFMTWSGNNLCISDTKMESNQVSASTAVGYSAIAGSYGSAFGQNSDARGGGATAIGSSSKAKGVDSTAVGYQSNANGSMSTSFGHNANASQTGCIAIGSSSKQAQIMLLHWVHLLMLPETLPQLSDTTLRLLVLLQLSDTLLMHPEIQLLLSGITPLPEVLQQLSDIMQRLPALILLQLVILQTLRKVILRF